LSWKEKLKEKIDMYDMIIANLIAGKTIIEPSKKLDNSQLEIGFSNISSEYQISKYFMISKLPDYLYPDLVDSIRNTAILPGVKINFYFYGYPYKINWDSAEMRNKISIWRKYYQETQGNASIWDYRDKKGSLMARERIAMSTKYLNEAELDYKRSLVAVTIIIAVSAKRDEDSVLNMIESIKLIKSMALQQDMRLRELRVNMIDWLQSLGIFSLRPLKWVESKTSRKILTDDLLAKLNSFKQGRVGKTGVNLGIDVLSNVPVLKKFKDDPDAPENWLISAQTGGGKSFFIKALITYLLADGFIVTVMDYEGDEYTNLAAYIKAGNSEDAKVVSMGKNSAVYVDPIQISDLTGDIDVDSELKATSINYTLAYFRLIVGGIEGNLTQWEERVISLAIQRAYDSVGVTDDKTTWSRSKLLTLRSVYEEIKYMVESKELVDFDADNVKHKAAVKVLESSSIYFEDGEAKSDTFKNPISVDELYKAKLIVFSFGMRGAANSTFDKTMLALKQLSVASLANQISNHAKYVKKKFNVKVWEEFQRWGEAKGSSEIIINAMTGGRKRGDVNFIITNDLSSILTNDNPVASGIRQNIQSMAIGKIMDRTTRHKFCETFDLLDSEVELENIAKAHIADGIDKSNDTSSSIYKHSFLLVLDSGKKAVVKVLLPTALAKSDIFKTGV